MPTVIPYSPACDRNKQAILNVISPLMEKVATVLEIGTGTGQHAVYFGKAFPEVIWQTSDQAHYLEGIRAQIESAASIDGTPLRNVRSPILLDVNQPDWLSKARQFDLVFTANTLHIMTLKEVTALFNGLTQVTKRGSYFIVYGPFKYQGEFTSNSNRDFDLQLRSRGGGSAIRDFEAVQVLANNSGFELLDDVSMPANNQCLIFHRTDK